MNLATPKQVKAIHAQLHLQGLLSHKRSIVDSYSKGRTESSKELTSTEAGELLSYLFNQKKEVNVSSKLMAKLFAMCHEMGWITQTTVVDGDKVKVKKDYSRVHAWVEKYGLLKKPLRKYTYNELPKLVTQFEVHIYNPYIESLSNKPTNEKSNNNPAPPATDNNSSTKPDENPFL